MPPLPGVSGLVLILEYDHFGLLGLLFDGGFHFGSGYGWLAHSDLISIGNKEHIVQLDCRALFPPDLFDVCHSARGDLVLFPSGCYYRVNGIPPLKNCQP